jgi:hypothetical protein
MATDPSEFIELAAELIGDEFAAFGMDTELKTLGGFDYETQTAFETSEFITMIKLGGNLTQFNGRLIETGDIVLIGEMDGLQKIPSPDGCEVIYDGQYYELISSKIDPANATITIHCRLK